MEALDIGDRADTDDLQGQDEHIGTLAGMHMAENCPAFMDLVMSEFFADETDERWTVDAEGGSPNQSASAPGRLQALAAENG